MEGELLLGDRLPRRCKHFINELLTTKKGERIMMMNVMNDNEYGRTNMLRCLDHAQTYASFIKDWNERNEIIDIIEDAKSKVMDAMNAVD